MQEIKPSSIFNFSASAGSEIGRHKQKERSASSFGTLICERSSAVRSLIVFFATLALLVSAIVALWKSALLRPLYQEHVRYEKTIAGYYPYDGEWDRHLLYNGLEGTAAALTRADILFLGNSRLLFSFRAPFLAPLAQRRGLRYYVLAFEYGETNVLPEAIIRKLDLHPRWVVVNVDGFFTDRASEVTERVMQRSSFATFKFSLEENAATWFRQLHYWLPHLEDLQGSRLFKLHALRSIEDGTIRVLKEPAGNRPWGPEDSGNSGTPSQKEVEIGRRFVESMRSRGARVLFSLVPGPRTSLQRAKALSTCVGVPFLGSSVESGSLRTYDGSHLTFESARRYVNGLVESLQPHL